MFRLGALADAEALAALAALAPDYETTLDNVKTIIPIPAKNLKNLKN